MTCWYSLPPDAITDYSPIAEGTMVTFPLGSVVGGDAQCVDINIVPDDITESLEVFTATLTNPQTSLQDITIMEPSTISITVSDCEWEGELVLLYYHYVTSVAVA